MSNILVVYIQKIQIWGLRGVVNYFLRKIRHRRLRRYFLDNASKHLCKHPLRGVTIMANFHSNLSLSKVMRDLAFSLRDAEIPFQAFDYGSPDEVFATDVDPVLTPRKEFRIRKFDHVIDMFSSPLPDELGLKRSHVVFWEFESGLLEAYPELNSPCTVIGMSEYTVATFRKLLPAKTPVRKLLYPFRFEAIGDLEPVDVIRRRYGIGKDDFVVFFNFYYGSSFFRKNPDGAMRAFAKAFPDTRNTRLVFKTTRAKEHRKEEKSLLRLAAELGVVDRFTTVDDFIPQRDLYGLTNACDVYLSLHRGEGFGLGIAEAMSLGKPVIVTNYSSTTEFCMEDNAIPIPYKMVDVHPGQLDHPCYLAVKACAEPDVDAAADALRRCYENPVFRDALGRKAKGFIEDHFSIENFKKSFEKFLDSEA